MEQRPQPVHEQSGGEPEKPRGKRRSQTLGITLAALWGFAEATLFFVVPDVLLTALAVSPNATPKRLALPIVAALTGALLGGFAIYTWSNAAPTAAEHAILAVPLIDQQLIDGIRAQTSANPARALILAGFTGKPYKIYALANAEQSTPPFLFAISSIAARAPRFIFTTLVSLLIVRTLLRNKSNHTRRFAHAAVWLMIYVAYYIIRTR